LIKSRRLYKRHRSICNAIRSCPIFSHKSTEKDNAVLMRVSLKF